VKLPHPSPSVASPHAANGVHGTPTGPKEQAARSTEIKADPNAALPEPKKPVVYITKVCQSSSASGFPRHPDSCGKGRAPIVSRCLESFQMGSTALYIYPAVASCLLTFRAFSPPSKNHYSCSVSTGGSFPCGKARCWHCMLRLPQDWPLQLAPGTLSWPGQVAACSLT